MGVVTHAEVQQVAHLARIQLQGQELDRLAAQIDQILTYIRQLQAVSTDGVEPTSHVLPLSNVLRRDEPQPCLPAEQVAQLAPARHGQLVKVPKIIE